MGRKSKNKNSRDDVLSRSQRRELSDLSSQLLEICSKPAPKGQKEWEEHVQVRGIVEKIRDIQKDMCLPMHEREKNVHKFENWLSCEGVDVSQVDISSQSDAGFGLLASKDMEEGDILMCIPRKLLMSTESVRRSELDRLASTDPVLKQMANVTLAIHLLLERAKSDSFWAPYIDILPTSFSIPLFYSLEDLELLKGSPSQAEALLQYRHIARQFAYFYRLWQTNSEASKLPLKEFCYDDYRWAVSVVMTRQNSVPIPDISGNEQIMALIPLWDMCNHEHGQFSSGWDVDDNSLRCLSMGPLKKGQEVKIFYGHRSNSERLIHNGFVPAKNESDRLPVLLGISKNDHLYALKAETLARLALMPSRMFSFMNADVPIDANLRAFCRVFVMDEDRLKEHLLGDDSTTLLPQLRSPEPAALIADTEHKAYQFVEMRATLLLRCYPTTLEEDDELLASQSLGEFARLCIQLRTSEKRLLARTRDWAAAERAASEQRLKAKQSQHTENHVETAADVSSDATPETDTKVNGAASQDEIPSVQRENQKQEILEKKLLETSLIAE